MEMTPTKMVFCISYFFDNSQNNRLLTLELFEQEVHDEQLRQTLNITSSLNCKSEDDPTGLGLEDEYPTDYRYRIIDVLIDELGNIFANVKELGIDI